MNKNIPYVFLFIVASACGGPAGETDASSKVTDKKGGEADPRSDYSYTERNQAFLGSFVGPFGNNKITLLLSRIWGDSVLGRSIVGGNDRPFLGILTRSSDGGVQIVGREPGDHRDDGVFRIVLHADRPMEMKGDWTPYNSSKSSKAFVLERKKFKYRDDVGYWPEASQRLLTEEEIENMMRPDLEMMRNEIFARHGFSFRKKDIRMVFEMEDWYVPNTVDITKHLTEIEKKNIMLIKRYEKYAEEYGDTYGR